MSNKKQIFLAAALGAIVGLSVILFRKAGLSDKQTTGITRVSPPSGDTPAKDSGPIKISAESFLKRWDETVFAKEKNGVNERKNLVLEALGSLRGSELGAFIEGLHGRREKEQVKWLIENGKKQMFGEGEGPKMREWLAGVADDELKSRLCFEAGYYFTGTGFKEYLMGLSPPSAQDRLLTGYCCGIAETEAVRAMDEFENLRPKNVTYLGFKEVVGHFPKDSDFTKIALRYGDDFTPGNSLAKSVRGLLLKRWAGFHPEQAGKFVVDHPKLAAVDQLRNVLTPWLDTGPDAAKAWVESLPEGVYRDMGNEILAKH